VERAAFQMNDQSTNQLEQSSASESEMIYSSPIDDSPSQFMQDLRSTILLSSNDSGLDDTDVPMQRRHAAPPYVLSDEDASVPCNSIGVDGLLEKFNYAAGAHFDRTPARNQVLQWCMNENYDFGMAYAVLSAYWQKQADMKNIAATDSHYSLEDLLKKREADTQMRENAIQDEFVQKNTPPRRLWDLYSNRVIPSFLAEPFGWCGAISHNWLAEEDRQLVDTPVNGYQWPVPIPKHTSLNRIRIEILNKNETMRYVWLDVLCLRQCTRSPEGEEKRAEEWKVDVPTIGRIYLQSDQVFYYMNGLGQPFMLGDLSHERHWINRTWTIQETVGQRKRVICGQTDDSILSDHGAPQHAAHGYISGQRFYRAVQDFWGTVHSITSASNNDVYPLLRAVVARRASNELDKISALAHLLITEGDLIPAYIIEDPESSWLRLLSVMDNAHRQQLLMLSRTSGYDIKMEYPTWVELNSILLPRDADWVHKYGLQEATLKGVCFRGWTIIGLSETSSYNVRPREGILTLPDGQIHSITVYHNDSIPDESYCAFFEDKRPQSQLMMPLLSEHEADFVIGHIEEAGQFKMISNIEVNGGLVVTMEDEPSWLLGKFGNDPMLVKRGIPRVVYPDSFQETMQISRATGRTVGMLNLFGLLIMAALIVLILIDYVIL
jgi:hypothetical protein